MKLLSEVIRVAGRTEDGDLVVHVPQEVEGHVLALIEIADKALVGE